MRHLLIKLRALAKALTATAALLAPVMAQAGIEQGRVVFAVVQTDHWGKDNANIAFNFSTAGGQYERVNGTKLSNNLWCAVNPLPDARIQLLRMSEDWSTQWNYSQTLNPTNRFIFHIPRSSSYDNISLSNTSIPLTTTVAPVQLKGDPVGGWDKTIGAQLQGTNFVREFTADTDGNIYFRFVIGPTEFGPQNPEQDQAVGTSSTVNAVAKLGKDNVTSAFYIPNARKGDRYRVSFSMHSSGVFYQLMGTSTTIPDGVNMPLTADDFADGKTHYFLVGSRMGDWHLQPEWELKPDDDGSFTVDGGRFLYPGMIGVAAVSSYADYVHQRYRLFADVREVKTRVGNQTENLNLTDQGNAQGYINYPVKDGGFDHNQRRFNSTNTTRFHYFRGATVPDIEALYSDERGVWVQRITLMLNSESKPYKLVMGQIQYDKTDERIFQLVGENIKYTNLPADLKTPMQDVTGSNSGWEQTFIQYDDRNRPYRDGNGEAVYQTVFQRTWTDSHQSLMDGASEGVYTTSTITFRDASTFTAAELAADPYADFYKMRRQPQLTDAHYSGNGYDYYEQRTDFHSDYIFAQSWKCLVLKDVDLRGQFKIWSGFGGGITGAEELDGNTDLHPRWNSENGQPGQKIQVVSGDITSGQTIPLYGIHPQDGSLDQNWTAGDDRWHHYDRIILWYNSDFGLEQSAIMFITENVKPEITMGQTAVTQCASGNASINYDLDQANQIITGYRIERYTIVNGEKVLDSVSTIEENTLTDVTAQSFGQEWFEDCEYKEPGTYVYTVTIILEDGSEQSDDSDPVYVIYPPEIQPEPVAYQLVRMDDGSYVTYTTNAHNDTYRLRLNGSNIETIEPVTKEEADALIFDPTRATWTTIFLVKGTEDLNHIGNVIHAYGNQYGFMGASGINIEEAFRMDNVPMQIVYTSNEYCVLSIVNLEGSLEPVRKTVSMQYFVFDWVMGSSTTITLTPVMPRAWIDTTLDPREHYSYTTSQPWRDMTAVAGSGEAADYVSVPFPSHIVGKPSQTVVLETENLNPRYLDVTFTFRQPNVEDAVLQRYDIRHTVSPIIYQQTGIYGGFPFTNGTYRYIDGSSAAPVDGPAHYSLTISGVHPAENFWHALQVSETVFFEPGNEYVATIGSDINIEARNKIAYGSPQIAGMTLRTDGNGTWRYVHHEGFLHPGDLIDNPLETPVEFGPNDMLADELDPLLLTPSFFFVETESTAVDGSPLYDNVSLAWYDPVAAHDDYHSETTPDNLAEQVIAEGFSSEMPTVHITPVYLFSRLEKMPEHGDYLTLDPDRSSATPAAEPSYPTAAIEGRQTVSLSDSNHWVAIPGSSITLTNRDMNTTGIDTVIADSDASVLYFNLQGMQIPNPIPGIPFIEQRGNQARKLIIK